MDNSSRIRSWVNDLGTRSEWLASVNSALDAIGFTDSTHRIMAARFRLNKPTLEIKDKIWGMIEVNESVVPILETPLVQRLRLISQVGFTPLTYPTARHSRFEHTLGVYHTVTKLLDRFDKNVLHANFPDGPIEAAQFTDYERTILCQAAILHDIGHTPFSHVTERAFERDLNMRRAGCYPLAEIIGSFNKNVRGYQHTTELGPSKLSEILSVIFITSSRFKEYYEAVFPQMTEKDKDPTADIACLILGLKVSESNPALPSIISGPMDADKIDYMIRDADACGIALTLDVSRIFLRAGLFRIKEVPSEFAVLGSEPLIFTLDKGGADTFYEFGSARVSLFSRVYYHHLTRNAEKCFFECLRLYNVRSSQLDASEVGEVADIFAVWAKPEQVLLYQLARLENAPEISSRAYALLNRRLPKRAAAFGNAFFLNLVPDWVDNHLDTRNRGNIGHTVESLDRIAEEPERESAFLEALRRETEQIKGILQGISEPLPGPADLLENLQLIGLGDNSIPALGASFIITQDGQLGRAGETEASFFEGRLLANSRGYVYADEPWRHLVAVAFQRVVLNQLCRDYTARYQVNGGDAGGEYAEELRGLHQPVLDLEAVARRCKLSYRSVLRIQRELAKHGYYDDAPFLINDPIQKDVVYTLSKKFRVYQGQGDWRANPHLLPRFVMQFPIGLRSEVLNLLKDIHILGPEEIVTELIRTIKRLPGFGDRFIHVAPLTASSGTFVRSVFRPWIKEHHEWEKAIFHASIEDAILAANLHDEVVLVDDNVASGTQARKQMRAWAGSLEKQENDPNISRASLSTGCQEKLCAGLRLSFAFCVGHEDGKKNVCVTGKECGWNVSEERVLYGKGLMEMSGRTKITQELRGFLKLVGKDLMAGKLRAEGKEEDTEEFRSRCENDALGYNSYEGLLVTTFNVPTSTYTALWCPGTYRSSLGKPERPWLPLFLRSGTLSNIVLP